MYLNRLTKKQIILLVALVAGIALMLIPGKEESGDIPQLNEALVLENKIAELIEKTYSANDVSVILTYDTNGEKITSAQDVDSENSFGISSNRNEPFVISEKLPYVRGVLISADNIDQVQSEQIRSAVATLLGISTSKVNVIY